MLDGNVIINEVDYRQVMELVLRSLTARDIRLVLKEQHVGSFGEMVQMLEKTPWDFYLPQSAKLHIEVTATQSKLYHEGKIKDLVTETVSLPVVSSDQASTSLFIEQSKKSLHDFLVLSRSSVIPTGFQARLQCSRTFSRTHCSFSTAKP